jgi:hypothetical protein
MIRLGSFEEVHTAEWGKDEEERQKANARVQLNSFSSGMEDLKDSTAKVVKALNNFREKLNSRPEYKIYGPNSQLPPNSPQLPELLTGSGLSGMSISMGTAILPGTASKGSSETASFGGRRTQVHSKLPPEQHRS